MPTFDIEAEGDAIERYSVVAENELEAREKFQRGDVEPAWSTEIQGSTIVSIVEEEE